ncbi:hypothetical protein CROQUDRAFT_659091 [Cronartium quercuum f. sp. fusiforme G11]|uniref:Uncharacterized protein n=1 Tax=Cronartium quercuum f. sp. fusiforme G11 TaxID=708437 RepID=A0A9P6NKB9_9BASI|nr:hypothetical protein CROQUDRAFT_659091 [Cronartium quercuum f. sp. fusiforme G11]
MKSEPGFSNFFAKFPSGFNLKSSKKSNKDCGITYSNFAKAKADELLRAKVKQAQVNCDQLSMSVARATTRSRQYDLQRSTKMPLRETPPFPINLNFSQRVIYMFEEGNTEDDESCCGCATCQPIGSTFPGARCPRLAMPSFSSPLLQGINDKLGWMCPSTPFKSVVEVLPQPTPATMSSTASSSCITPATPLSTSATTLASAATVASYLTTPALTNSTSSTRSTEGQRALFTGLSGTSSSQNTPGLTLSPSSIPTDGRSLPKETPRKPPSGNPNETLLVTLGNALQSPADLPSPVVLRGGPEPEMLAGLDFLEKLGTTKGQEECENVIELSRVKVRSRVRVRSFGSSVTSL